MRSAVRRGAPFAVALAAVLLLATGSQQVRAVHDLTEDRTLTLTDETLDVLDEVGERVRATVFLREDDPARVDAISLLTRYRRANRHISFRTLDPDDAPGEVRLLGVDPILGGIALRQGDAVEVAATPTEQDVTAAITRLLRGRSATLCYATGHGEPAVDSPASDGLARAAQLLRDNGYRVETVDLLARADVPDGCDALLLVAPTAPLGDATAVLRRWLAEDGRLLLLTDPASDVDLDGVVGGLGLRIDRGIVLEGDDDFVFPGDPASPIVRTYSTSHPVARRLPPTYFPGVQSVEVDDDHSVPGLTVSRIADTTPESWLDQEPLAARFDEGVDTPGPITVVAAADRSRIEGNEIVRSRVVVAGDADFATNTFLGEAGNSRLLVQAVDWLTLDEELVVLSTHVPRDRPLSLTVGRSRYALFLSSGVVPGLFLLAGGTVWAVRRGR